MCIRDRPGTYHLRVSFAEPRFTEPNQRAFHLDVENRRVLLNADPVKMTGAMYTTVQRSYRVTTSDGRLSLELEGLPVLSFIEIVRV